MTQNILPAVLLALALAACEPGKKDIDQQVTGVVSDTGVLKEANAAANVVIRAAGDCAAVKAALEEANRKLDEAERNVRTVVGRTTIETLKKQVRALAEACP